MTTERCDNPLADCMVQHHVEGIEERDIDGDPAATSRVIRHLMGQVAACRAEIEKKDSIIKRLREDLNSRARKRSKTIRNLREKIQYLIDDAASE